MLRTGGTHVQQTSNGVQLFGTGRERFFLLSFDFMVSPVGIEPTTL
jgi:hypothetical protein